MITKDIIVVEYMINYVNVTLLALIVVCKTATIPTYAIRSVEIFPSLLSSFIPWKSINKLTKPNTNAGIKIANVAVTGNL